MDVKLAVLLILAVFLVGAAYGYYQWNNCLYIRGLM